MELKYRSCEGVELSVQACEAKGDCVAVAGEGVPPVAESIHVELGDEELGADGEDGHVQGGTVGRGTKAWVTRDCTRGGGWTEA